MRISVSALVAFAVVAFVREVEGGRWRCTGLERTENTGTAKYLNWIFGLEQ